MLATQTLPQRPPTPQPACQLKSLQSCKSTTEQYDLNDLATAPRFVLNVHELLQAGSNGAAVRDVGGASPTSALCASRDALTVPTLPSCYPTTRSNMLGRCGLHLEEPMSMLSAERQSLQHTACTQTLVRGSPTRKPILQELNVSVLPINLAACEADSDVPTAAFAAVVATGQLHFCT